MTQELIAILAMGCAILGSNVVLWTSLNGLASRVGRMEGILSVMASRGSHTDIPPPD